MVRCVWRLGRWLGFGFAGMCMHDNDCGDTARMLHEYVDEIKNDLGGLSFSVSGTTLSITNGTNTWTLSQ